MNLRSVYLPLASLLLAMPVLAQESAEAPAAAAEEAASPWAGKVSFGFLSTTGNTENSNMNGSFEVSYTAGKWRHVLDAYAINATENKETTAEAYGGGWLSERRLTDHDFLFGRLNYRNDRFSGFPTQFSQTVGYGRNFFDTGVHSLVGEIGAGARQSERADGTDVDDFIGNGRLNYRWTFSETARFDQGFLVEYGQNNTYFESVSEVRAQLLGQLGLLVSYTIKNNSDVPVGSVKTDTFTAISLEYAF